MQTFLTAQQELANTPYLNEAINAIKSKSLFQRIYDRGIREQRNAYYLANYYPHARKRLVKSVANQKFFLMQAISGKNQF